MTASTVLPEPIRLDAFRAGATDVRGVDFSGDLQPLADQLDGVTVSVVVQMRDDGMELIEGDLAIMAGSAALDTSGMQITWVQTCSETNFANGVTVDYRIRVEASTTKERLLIVDAMCLVMPTRG